MTEDPTETNEDGAHPPVRSAGTHRSTYPLVANWLEGASSDHWWLKLLNSERRPGAPQPTWADEVLEPLERLIDAIQSVNPEGMGNKKDSFRDDSDDANVLGMRLELLCAALLARQQISFRFGGMGQPDLAFYPSTDREAWLEIHRRDLANFTTLRRNLTTELEPKNSALIIHVDEWPLDVAQPNMVLSRVAHVADTVSATGEVRPVALPEFGPQARGMVSPANGPFSWAGAVTLSQYGSPFLSSERYCHDAAIKVAAKIEEKASQARRGCWSPKTALMIDISSARQLGCLETGALAAWFNDVQIEWDDLPFAGVAVSFSDLHSVSLRGICRYKPRLEAHTRECLEPILTLLGLQATPS